MPIYCQVGIFWYPNLCRFMVGMLSVCYRFEFRIVGLLSVTIPACAYDRFSISMMSVMYRSQIGRFHTESYPRWPRHETDCFYGVFSNIVGGRQVADSLKILRVLSVSCRFGRCDWGITPAKPTRNQPQTDKKHQVRGEIGLQSVLIRFCRFGVGLCSGRQICRGEIFQSCLKDLSPTNCRLSVGYMSVWCRFCLGAFRDVSVLIRPPMVDAWFVGLRLITYRAYLTPIQGRFKTDSSPT